jgi:hypothetical protein
MTEIRIIMLAALLGAAIGWLANEPSAPQNMPKNTPTIYQHIYRNVT